MRTIRGHGRGYRKTERRLNEALVILWCHRELECTLGTSITGIDLDCAQALALRGLATLKEYEKPGVCGTLAKLTELGHQYAESVVMTTHMRRIPGATELVQSVLGNPSGLLFSENGVYQCFVCLCPPDLRLNDTNSDWLDNRPVHRSCKEFFLTGQ